jgi:hypothetical protein
VFARSRSRIGVAVKSEGCLFATVRRDGAEYMAEVEESVGR